MEFTNEQGIGLSMAVFLVNDDYDYDGRPNAISSTGTLKSLRQIILSRRSIESTTSMDISQLVASSFGTAIHDGVEKAWLEGRYKKALAKLGHPQGMIGRVVVNPGYNFDAVSGQLVPDPGAAPMAADAIPVYIEIRTEKMVDGYIVTGKFDFVGAGKLEDHKTTSTFTYAKGTNNEKFRLQGSIYRWLNPTLITADQMLINYVFTDWSGQRAKAEAHKNYPPYRMMSVPLTLLSLEDTQKFLEGKIRAIKANISADEGQLPLCTKDELWQEDTVYKYYKNPASKLRSTKNFAHFSEAQMRLVKDGSVGVVDIIPGEAKFCKYCLALPICSQAKQLIADGLLHLEV